MPAIRCLAVLLSLGLAAAGGVQASAASAYTTLGLTGLADFDPPSFSGGSWQDGVYTPLAPAAGLYATYANPFGQDGASAGLSVTGAVAPAPGEATLPLNGAVGAFADLVNGNLGLHVNTQLVPVTNASGAAVSAFSAGNASAEVGEAFDVLLPYAGGTPGPVQVRLQLRLTGLVIDDVNDASVALRATLRLNHVAEGVAGVLTQQQTYGAGFVNDVITLDATLIDPTCSVSAGRCSYFFGFYSALESVGQVPIGSGSYAVVAAGDQLMFDNGGSLSLVVSTGAVVTDASTGQTHSWVSAVPEPGAASLWGVGLLGMGALRRSWRR